MNHGNYSGLSWLICLFLYAPCTAQSLTVACVNADTFVVAQPITSHFQFLTDERAAMPFAEAQRLEFHTYQPSVFALEANSAHWFRVKIENTGKQKSLNGFLHISCAFDWMDAWLIRGNAVEHLTNGDLCNFAERAYSENWESFPLSAKPGEQMEMLLRLRNCCAPSLHSPVFMVKSVPTMEHEMRLHPAQTIPTYLFGAVFLIMLVLLTIIGLVSFAINRYWAFAWYALYLLSNLLFYLRSFEKNMHCSILFSHWQRHYIGIEAAIGYCCFFIYLLFLRAFLETATLSPRLDKLLLWSAWALVSAWLVNFILWATLGEEACYAVYSIARLSFFGLTLFILYPLLFGTPGVLPRLVGIGTLCIAVPALATLAGGFWLANTIQLAGGTARVLIFPNGLTIFMVNTRIGILLEMLCFGAGLAWKFRLERDGRLSALRDAAENRRHAETLRRILKTHLQHAAAIAQKEPDLARKARELVEQNLDNTAFGIQQLARALGKSRSELYRDFESVAQKTPHQFIRDIRLDHACRLLSSTSLSISDIAFQTGFNDPSNFSKIFLDVFGQSPSLFRRDGGMDWD